MHMQFREINFCYSYVPTILQVSGSIFEEVVKSGQKLNIADIEKVRSTVNLPLDASIY